MEQAALNYISFALQRSKINADTTVPLAEQTRSWSPPNFPAHLPPLRDRPLAMIVTDYHAGGRAYTPENLQAAAAVYEELFSFCVEQLETASPVPENPVRYLCEVVFHNAYFFEDYITMMEFSAISMQPTVDHVRCDPALIDLVPRLLRRARVE